MPKRSRATAEQLSRMVDFLMETPGLAQGKFQKLHGKVENDRKWAELTDLLNSLGGAVKTLEQWHTVRKISLQFNNLLIFLRNRCGET